MEYWKVKEEDMYEILTWCECSIPVFELEDRCEYIVKENALKRCRRRFVGFDVLTEDGVHHADLNDYIYKNEQGDFMVHKE